MAAIETRPARVSNVLKKELWPEEFYCRKVISLTYADIGATPENGLVVVDDGATGTYAAIPVDATALAATDPVAIVLDPELSEKIAADVALGTPLNVVAVGALVKGPATVRVGGLSYGALVDGTGNIDIAKASLETSGINIATHFSVNTQGA